MTETLLVSISGPAFSFLLYENLKAKYWQEGFLLGELVEKETKSITDSDQEQIHISRTIKINNAVPCLQRFYDGVGRIDQEKIRSFLGDMAAEVVAWYKYKANTTSFKLSFREKNIHKQLSDFFKFPPEFFSCCLLINENPPNSAKSIHSFSQTFMRHNNQKYDQIPMHIINLSDPLYSYKTPEPLSDTSSKLVNSLELNPGTTGGPSITMKIQQALQKRTEQLVEELSEAEERLYQLEKEVELLMSSSQEEDLTSASNNDQLMDTDSERSNSSSPIKSRGRGKANAAPKTRKANQNPVKKNTSGRGIVSKSMKNNM